MRHDRMYLHNGILWNQFALCAPIFWVPCGSRPIPVAAGQNTGWGLILLYSRIRTQNMLPHGAEALATPRCYEVFHLRQPVGLVAACGLSKYQYIVV